MRILKFGGKSLDTIQKVQNVCKNIKKIYKNDKKIIVVVSAMGKTTDLLIEKMSRFCGTHPSQRELDVLLSTGETESSALFASVLVSMGVPAKSFQGFQLNLETFGDFQNSKISYLNKKPLTDSMENGVVCVVSGFQGINKNGDITTLGRGGSDTTAAAIGSVFDHDVEIYSDFNGIFCGNPRFLNFKKIKRINKNTMITMAKNGAKVLDFRAAQIAKQFGFNIIAKSSTDFKNRGTVVSDIENNVVAISWIDNLSKVTITFSENNKLDFFMKNVISQIKQLNFYNLTVENDNISFYVSDKNKDEIIYEISKKLNLLKK